MGALEDKGICQNLKMFLLPLWFGWPKVKGTSRPHSMQPDIMSKFQVWVIYFELANSKGGFAKHKDILDLSKP